MLGKNPAVSKTIWINVLVVLVAAFEGVRGCDFVQGYPEWAAAVVVLIGAVNVGLRFLTKSPLKL